MLLNCSSVNLLGLQIKRALPNLIGSALNGAITRSITPYTVQAPPHDDWRTNRG